jgi:acyl carrier protein
MPVEEEFSELARTTVLGSLRTMLKTMNLVSTIRQDLGLTSMDMILLSDMVEETLGIKFSDRNLRLFTGAEDVSFMCVVTVAQLNEDMAAHVSQAGNAWKAAHGIKVG